MKNRLIALFLLSIALLVPLSAASGDGSGTTPGGQESGDFKPGSPWEPVYRLIRSSELNIKAYKNSPNTLTMTVFDALTGTLNELSGTNEKIDIYPYIGKFLSNAYTSSLLKPQDPNDDKAWLIGDKDKVLFSYMVTGTTLGSYTLKVKVCPFYRVDITSNELIKAHFELAGMNVRFPSTGGSTLNNGNIDFIERPEAGVEPADKTGAELSVKWQVTNPGANKTSDIWTSEGVILMAVDKAGYEASPAGAFQSDVVVTLEVL